MPGKDIGNEVPKIIDFGLAKAMERTQKLTDQSLVTGIGQILGTLKQMSPEQASLDTVDIDTRTEYLRDRLDSVRTADWQYASQPQHRAVFNLQGEGNSP